MHMGLKERYYKTKWTQSLLIPLDDLSLVIPSKDGFRAVREFSVARDANINFSSLANAFLISPTDFVHSWLNRIEILGP